MGFRKGGGKGGYEGRKGGARKYILISNDSHDLCIYAMTRPYDSSVGKTIVL